MTESQSRNRFIASANRVLASHAYDLLKRATGEVRYDTKKSQSTDVLAFFKLIDLHGPKDLDVHVVFGNLSAHKAEPVTRWLAHPKRARCTCTSPRPGRLAELRRGLVLSAHQAPAEARYVHLRRRPRHRNRALGRAPERRPSPSSGSSPPKRSSPRSLGDGPDWLGALPRRTTSAPRRAHADLSATRTGGYRVGVLEWASGGA